MAQRGFIDLGRRGMDYVREHLTGVNPFCTALGAAVDAAPGRVLVLPPPGVDLERLYLFSEGGLLAANRSPSDVTFLEDGSSLVEVATMKVEQAAYLVSLLRTVPEAICIIDDFNPSWTEAVAMGVDQHAFHVDDAVYYRFTADDAPDDIVLALRNSETIWHSVAAICAVDVEVDEESEASVEALQQVGASVIALTCTAYDGEGFVIWRRD